MTTALRAGMKVCATGKCWGVGVVLRVAEYDGLDGRRWGTFRFGEWTFECPAEGFEPVEEET